MRNRIIVVQSGWGLVGDLDRNLPRHSDEAIVRLVLSHLVRPSKPPVEAAADIARLVELALVGTATRLPAGA